MDTPILPPFYFIVVFWGQVYREYCTNLLFASLLSPHNIPCLKNLKKSKFIICTTTEDRLALEQEPIFILLTATIEVIFIPMRAPKTTDSKMYIMSQGHKLTSEYAYNHKAIGVFLTPDLILSDGSVASLQKLAEQGKKVVLCAALRFEHFGCLTAFKNLGLMQPGKPLTIASRTLIKIALNNLHSETKRYNWDTNYFAETPVSCVWFTLKTKNAIIHTFSWAPLVLNYAALNQHDTKTFEEWTLDGDYVYKNFGLDNDIYIVTDTDEIALISFTKEEDLHIPAVPKDNQNNFLSGSLVKMNYIHTLYHDTNIIDPLKQKLFTKAVYFHSSGISLELKNLSLKAKILVKLATQLPLSSCFGLLFHILTGLEKAKKESLNLRSKLKNIFNKNKILSTKQKNKIYFIIQLIYKNFHIKQYRKLIVWGLQLLWAGLSFISTNSLLPVIIVFFIIAYPLFRITKVFMKYGTKILNLQIARYQWLMQTLKAGHYRLAAYKFKARMLIWLKFLTLRLPFRNS